MVVFSSRRFLCRDHECVREAIGLLGGHWFSSPGPLTTGVSGTGGARPRPCRTHPGHERHRHTARGGQPMMGHGHATMGAAGWIARTGTTAGLGLLHMEPAQIAAGALITAGAALLPDADHHSGTIAYSLPPLSGLITRAVGQASGGH